MPRVEITDYEKWGNLLKTWATGENRLGDGKSYSLPKTPQELKDQMALAGDVGKVPDEIKSIQFIVPDSKTLVLILPSKEDIVAGEAAVTSGAPYPLPAFYKDAFGTDVKHPLDWLKFNAQRLGEYLINNCQ